MNVIISNKYQSMLSTLNIETIRTLNGVYTVDELADEFKNFFYNKMIIDITAIQNYEDISNIQKLSMAFDSSKLILLLDDSLVVNSPVYLSQLVSMGIYNFTKNINAISFLINNPNSYKDVASYQNLEISSSGMKEYRKSEMAGSSVIEQRVLGIRNLTDHAGSTTLAYLLMKHLEKEYRVIAAELNNHDFELFEEDGLESITSSELENFIANHKDYEVIVVDMGDVEPNHLYTDVLYLIEPGLVPLNKMVRKDDAVLTKIKNQKLILNKSILNQRQVEDFERESRTKIFYNVPYVDDKDIDNTVINDFLFHLGFTRFDSSKR